METIQNERELWIPITLGKKQIEKNHSTANTRHFMGKKKAHQKVESGAQSRGKSLGESFPGSRVKP